MQFIQQPLQQSIPLHHLKTKSKVQPLSLTRTGNADSTFQYLQPNLSVTEKEILSHDIVSEVMEKSRKKTVQHQINKVDKNARLYSCPQQHSSKEYQFDTIPPKNSDYFSQCSKKVNEINHRLSDERNLSEKLTQLAQKNKQKAKRYRTLSDHQNINKRVSLSGLVSYNFNSVNARRSLGVIPNDPDDVSLEKRVNKVKAKNSCSLDRQLKILKKGNRKQTIQLNKAAVCNFHMPTQKFLKVLASEKKKKERVFGNQFQKLLCIKEYMEQEKVTFQQAQFIVNQITKKPKKAGPPRHRKMYSDIDDEELLKKRKLVQRKKKVMIRNVHFVD